MSLACCLLTGALRPHVKYSLPKSSSCGCNVYTTEIASPNITKINLNITLYCGLQSPY